MNKQIKDVSKIKLIKTIKTQYDFYIILICELKDKRIVSASKDGSIFVYDQSYQPQIYIKDAHKSRISSLCIFHNDKVYILIKTEDVQLMSPSYDNTINVYKSSFPS